MSGLILKLRPREQLMVNGVVIENGDRRTSLRIKSNGARILRLRDAIDPATATTPIKRAYLLAQLAVAGELSTLDAANRIRQTLSTIRFANSADTDEILHRIDQGVENDNFYRAMRKLGALARQEDDRAAASAAPARTQ